MFKPFNNDLNSYIVFSIYIYTYTLCCISIYLNESNTKLLQWLSSVHAKNEASGLNLTWAHNLFVKWA